MQIVLIEPQIPQNTGSIARTCAATNTPLHIVGPTPFEVTDKAARRAGLDYWPHVALFRHKSWDGYLNTQKDGRIWYFTKFATKPYAEANFSKEDSLVFGSETKGLGEDFLEMCPKETQLKIPMFNGNVRSLNLSNAVSIALYEALRQQGFKQ